MEKTYHIALNDFCKNHNIEISFIESLQNTGLIEASELQEAGFIEVEQLMQLEMYVRFHYDLDINLEGIETIMHLLNRIETQHKEIVKLKNKLMLYELNE